MSVLGLVRFVPIVILSLFAGVIADRFNRQGMVIVVALILIGAADGLSTIIRNTVRQLQTPDELRGRIVSINQIFFKGGPQLGEMESGLVAQVLGIPFAIISGGVGCLVAAGIVLKKFPQLFKYDGHREAELSSG